MKARPDCRIISLEAGRIPAKNIKRKYGLFYRRDRRGMQSERGKYKDFPEPVCPIPINRSTLLWVP